jgi:hypothetical protein
MTRILFQLLLLPVIVIGLPLMFGAAWLREAVDDRRLRHQSL